jgi:hypothetical protein
VLGTKGYVALGIECDDVVSGSLKKPFEGL